MAMPSHLLVPLLLPAALLLDRLFGEPPEAVHPVCAMGALAVRAERGFRRIFRCEEPAAGRRDALRARLAGVLAGGGILLAFSAIPYAITALAAASCPLWGSILAALCLWLCMAPTSLDRHARLVLAPLEDGDLEAARRAVSRIVGRETKRLDRHGVARACVESIAENLVDGVLASLFWAVAGYLLLGLPGAAALAFLQRAANTLDAMWGKKDGRYRHFGTFAARCDDVLDWPCARLALPSIALAALAVPGCRAGAALAVGWRYRHAHESPNSAWSEAAFAGALGLRLGGPAVYAGMPVAHPWLGDGTPDAGAAHIRTALALMWATTLLFTLAGALVLFLAAFPS